MAFRFYNSSRLNSNEKKYYEIFIFAVLMFEFAVLCPGIQDLNQWTITGYFLSYQDLGFNSRLFIGSVFRLFSEYISLSTLYFILCVIVTGMNAFVAITLGRVLRRGKGDQLSSLLVFTVLFLASPFSLSFLFDKENFAIQDMYLFIITVIMMLIVRHKYLKWLIPGLCFAAVAIHQGFIMTFMPVIAIILIYEWYKNRFKLSGLILCGSSFLAVILLSVYFQFFAPGLAFASAEDVVEHLAHRTDYILYPDAILIEYFINVVNSFAYEIRIIESFALPYSVCVFFMTLPLMVFFLLLWASALKKTKDRFSKFIILLCLSAPLISVPIFIGNDWDRWISAVFITQFLLVFYFLDSGLDSVLESAAKISAYCIKHKILFVLIVLFLSLLIFSADRLLFYILQQSAADIFNEMLENAKSALK